MRVISWILYIPLQIIALPVCLLGMLLVTYRQMWISKRLGVSQTAIEVFNARWTLHVFGMRNDPGAAKLGPELPNTSIFGTSICPIQSVPDRSFSTTRSDSRPESSS